MSDAIFNTNLESSLRLAILLDVAAAPMDIDDICASDFVATYCGYFSKGLISVNGDNRFMFSEYSARRETSEQALKSLVMRGLVSPVVYDQGYAYYITEDGSHFVSELNSDYATEYRNGAEFAIEYVEEYGVDNVIFDITSKAL